MDRAGKKVASIIVAACFLLNAAISDLAFGQITNADKLAVPLQTGDIIGMEKKDIGIIKFTLEEKLHSFLPGNISAEMEEREAMINLLGALNNRDFRKQMTSHSIAMLFTPISKSDQPCVMARLKDGKRISTYYAKFSFNKDPDNGFRIDVLTEEQFKSAHISTGNIPKAHAALVESLQAVESADSRGKPTVACTLKLGGLEVTGDVPAGASKGMDEAQTVNTDQAIKNINEVIAPMLMKSGLDLRKHEDLIKMEKMMIAAAGDNFTVLGANATVPVSRALWKMAAKLHGMELYEYIRTYEPDAVYDNPDLVHFYMNIYNGGLHALKAKDGEVLGKDRIDIQEIMIVPVGNKTHKEALEMGDKVDHNLKELLSGKFDQDKITRADEAGFSVKGLGNSEEAIAYVFQAITDAGYKVGEDIKLALDVAASSFYDEEKNIYRFQGKEMTSDDMVAFYVDFIKKYGTNVISIEDALAENDWGGWKNLTAEMNKAGVDTIGDDLFVTQLPRLERGISEESASAILIKVNQNGTMYGTLETIKRAKEAGMQSVVSHRSGETMDDSIADLAYGVNALGLKTGDPQPDADFGKGGQYEGRQLVRRVKYLRMVEMEEHAARVQRIEELDALFGAQLTSGDASVIPAIVTYNSALTTSDDKQFFYEWLQHHESALAAEAIAKVGLNWVGVVDKLISIITGKIKGNCHSAARQLQELAEEGTYGGLTAPVEVASQAKKAFDSNSEAVLELVKPLALPEAPKVAPGTQPGVLLLIRHGETSWSEAVLNKWAGWHDASITSNGDREAFGAGLRMNGVDLHFDFGATSDLSRAQFTMQRFLKGFGQSDLPVTSYWELRERNYGDLIGWRRAIVQRVFGDDQYKKWRRGLKGNDVRPAGGENTSDVMERSIPLFVENILKRIAAGENVAISAHGNSLRSILIYMRGFTNGEQMSEEEVMKLEVPLSTPIVVTFDKDLKHKELWVAKEVKAEEVNGFLASRQSAEQKEISAMASLAPKAGVPISMERYNLLLPAEFFAEGELEKHKMEYAGRFDLNSISGATSEQLVDNILAKAGEDGAKTIALVSKELSAEQLGKLTEKGIRFMRVDVTDLVNARADKDAYRENFQVDTYAMMLLLRQIDNNSIAADSPVYKLLSYYLKTHFQMTDNIAVDDYITAIIHNEVAKLIKGHLLYRPIQPYDMPEYNKVAMTLISA